MDTTDCPECGALAEVEWRAVLESTDGPVEHARIRCVHRHCFLLPTAALEAAGRPGTYADTTTGPPVAGVSRSWA